MTTDALLVDKMQIPLKDSKVIVLYHFVLIHSYQNDHHHPVESLKFFCLEKEVFKFEGWKPFSLSKPSFSKWRNGGPRGPVTYTRSQSCLKSGPQPHAPGLRVPASPCCQQLAQEQVPGTNTIATAFLRSQKTQSCF